MDEKVLEFAKKYGFAKVKRLGERNGYIVYVPLMEVEGCYGVPVTIHAKEGYVNFARSKKESIADILYFK